MLHPNLFDYATHELSQDAVLFWLFRYADSRYREEAELHKVAQKFTRLFLPGYCKEIDRIEVWKQWEKIDITVAVNGERGIILEDKVGAHLHGDQLRRYRVAGEKWADQEKIEVGYFYLNTENIEPDDRANVEKEEYTIVTRRQILDVLEEYKGDNAILCDFRDRVASLEEQTERFKEKPFTEWTDLSWQGFYDWIRQHREDCTWQQLKPPGVAPYFGIWWNNHCGDIGGEVALYLQIDQGRLTFKMYGETDHNREWGCKILECLERYANELNITEMRRAKMSFRGFSTMIMAVNPDDYLGSGKIDLGRVLAKFELYEGLVERCKAELNG